MSALMDGGRGGEEMGAPGGGTEIDSPAGERAERYRRKDRCTCRRSECMLEGWTEHDGRHELLRGETEAVEGEAGERGQRGQLAPVQQPRGEV